MTEIIITSSALSQHSSAQSASPKLQPTDAASPKLQPTNAASGIPLTHFSDCL